ncbi:MAG: type VII secretion protein EccC, partial [Mycobacterium sp.]
MGPVDSTATVEFVPPGRVPPPVCETADVVVAAPQEVTRKPQMNLMIRVLPVVTAVATVGTMAVVFSSRSSAARTPAFMMFPLMMLVSAAATVFSGADRRRGEINAERAEFLCYLSDLRDAAVKTAAAQHYSLSWCHPDPDTLWTLVGGCRMWERRAADPDFFQLRIGIGTLGLATRLISPTIGSAQRLDPVAVTALGRFLQTHSTIPDAPISIALRGLATVNIGGDTTQARALLRATLCQLAVMHSPRLVLIAAAVSDHHRSDWEWLKWLPHNRHPHASDDVGSTRMVYGSPAAAKKALSGITTDPAAPHVVVVVDDDVIGGNRWAIESATDGITLLTIQSGDEDSSSAGALRLRAGQNEVVVASSGDDDVVARADHMSYTAALTCAQRLARYRA